jgi:hypothetical protein
MTQRAITEAIAAHQGGGGGGTMPNFNSEDEGKIVVIGENGEVVAGELTEEEIANAIGHAGNNNLQGVVGLEIDYVNKSFKRIQEAEYKQAGNDFNQYPMYGGRMRCNVADDGTILAWYGDNNYKDDGSNGQVMIY